MRGRTTTRRHWLSAIACLVSAAVLGMLAIGPLLRPSTAAHIYTPAEVEGGLTMHPHTWIGRTVLVRGKLYPVGLGEGGSSQFYTFGSSTMVLDANVDPGGLHAFLRRVPVIGVLVPDPYRPFRGPAIYRLTLLGHRVTCPGGAPTVTQGPAHCPDALLLGPAP